MSKQFLLERWRSTRLITDERVLKAFEKIPREDFVPPEFKSMAYDDVPLPIGGEQTISQPSTVMLMLQALELKPTDKVLEIGAGSGYNAALLGKLCKEVVSLEVIGSLSLAAGLKLKKLGITNVKVVNLDGGKGYTEKAPYDKIILTAAPRKIPQVLFDQLKDGGILLAPVGERWGQQMMRYRKHGKEITDEYLGDFAFVPMV